MSISEVVYLAWFSAKPLSAQCVQQFKRQRRLGWNVRMLLSEDVNTLTWMSPADRAAFHAATSEDDQFQIVRRASHSHHDIILIQMDAGVASKDAAVAIYTLATVCDLLPSYPPEYACYVIPLATGHCWQQAQQSTWTPLSHAMPPNEQSLQHASWLVTSPHLLPQLAAHEFVAYTRADTQLDTTLLNRAVVDMLHENRAIGLCEHEVSFPSVYECLHHMNVRPQKLVEYIKWRLSAAGGSLDKGSDGHEGRRLFGSALSLVDMTHPSSLQFASRWALEAAWSGEETVSLFFASQLNANPLPLVLPGDLNKNSRYYFMKRLTTVPRHLPVIQPNHVVVETVIPRKLHVIWLGEVEPPDYCKQYVERWSSLMPNWEIKLWRDHDAARFGDDVQKKISSAVKGAQKADILRAFVVESEGGFYVDADVEPCRSLEPLVQLQEPLLLCHDLPLTWEYMSSGFLGAAPHHPLIQFFCHHLLSSTLNTKDIHMQTGPRALGHAIRHAPNPTGRKYYMLPSRAFYFNEHTPDAFGRHKYANTWNEK